jgi:hypothetical protein
MLFSLLIQHPQALPSILARTPAWVWGLLIGLIALGVSQCFERRANASRVALLPIAMAGLSVFSLGAALKASGDLPAILAVWLIAAGVSAGVAIAWRAAPPAGTCYDAGSRQFNLPGSHVPLVLILAIFLTKYTVAIELAMQPGLVQNARFALSMAALYGLFNGVLAARALRLWRLKRLSTSASHNPTPYSA